MACDGGSAQSHVEKTNAPTGTTSPTFLPPKSSQTPLQQDGDDGREPVVAWLAARAAVTLFPPTCIPDLFPSARLAHQSTLAPLSFTSCRRAL